MKDKAENPQAFPSDEISQDGVSLNCQHQGMTLRDYFAAKAMQAIVTAKLINGGKDFVVGQTGKSNEPTVKSSYALADAMLNERNK